MKDSALSWPNAFEPVQVLPTVQIFVSHSRDDPPPWHTIKQQVAISRCLFVSLSKPLLNWDYRHTGNWIDFEVGLACM